VLRAFIRYARCLPKALDKLHLQWALREIDPMHPNVPLIVHLINELDSGRAA
jgi:hypothetical protein